MTRDDVKTVMAAVVVLWPNATPAPAGYEKLAVDVWMAMIGDLDKDAVLATLQVISAHEASPFAPPVGVVRERTLSVLAEVSGTGIKAAADAWRSVLTQIGTTGRTGHPEFTDKATAEAVDAIGWRVICDSTNLGMMERQFVRAYEIFSSREHRDMVTPPAVMVALEQAASHLALESGSDDPTVT